MKHVFIIDSESFYGQRWRMDGLLESIRRRFADTQDGCFAVEFSRFPRDAIGIVQKHIDKTDNLRVHAVGGDAVLSDCLNAIAGRPNAELAPVPYGKTNRFIISFGEQNAETFKNIEYATNANIIPTDVIVSGSIYALTACAIGFAPAVEIKTMQGENGGAFATDIKRFFVALCLACRKNTASRHYRIEIDGIDYSGIYEFVLIVNAPYFKQDGEPVPGVSCTDGFMEVLLFRPAGIFNALTNFAKYHNGKLPSGYECVTARKAEISCGQPMHVQMDSEYFSDTQMTFKVAPQFAKIAAPSGARYRES